MERFNIAGRPGSLLFDWNQGPPAGGAQIGRSPANTVMPRRRQLVLPARTAVGPAVLSPDGKSSQIMSMGDLGRRAQEAHDPLPLGTVGTGSPAVEEEGYGIMGHFVGYCRGERFTKVPREKIGIEPQLMTVSAALATASILPRSCARQIKADFRQSEAGVRVPRDDLKAATHLIDHACEGCRSQPGALHMIPVSN